MAKRVTSIGGQALLEGILLVGPKKNVACSLWWIPCASV